MKRKQQTERGVRVRDDRQKQMSDTDGGLGWHGLSRGLHGRFHAHPCLVLTRSPFPHSHCIHESVRVCMFFHSMTHWQNYLTTTHTHLSYRNWLLGLIPTTNVSSLTPHTTLSFPPDVCRCYNKWKEVSQTLREKTETTFTACSPPTEHFHWAQLKKCWGVAQRCKLSAARCLCVVSLRPGEQQDNVSFESEQ